MSIKMSQVKGLVKKSSAEWTDEEIFSAQDWAKEKAKELGVRLGGRSPIYKDELEGSDIEGIQSAVKKLYDQIKAEATSVVAEHEVNSATAVIRRRAAAAQEEVTEPKPKRAKDKVEADPLQSLILEMEQIIARYKTTIVKKETTV